MFSVILHSAKRIRSSDDNGELEHRTKTKQHEQHYGHPDLVPNDDAVEKQRIEMDELECLCQSFALQINLLKAEVSRRNDWFHALLIAAQYFLQVIISSVCTLIFCFLIIIN